MADQNAERIPEGCNWRLSRRCAHGILVSVAVMLLVGYFLTPTCCLCIGQWLDCGEPVQEPVEIAYILGGNFETRPYVASELIHADLANKVLVSAPAKQSETLIPDEATIVSTILISQNVPPNRILRQPLQHASTRGEIVALRNELREDETAAVITNDFHTRRVRILISKIFSERDAKRIQVVSCPTHGFGPTDWWRYESGIQLYLAEVLKVTLTIIGVL